MFRLPTDSQSLRLVKACYNPWSARIKPVTLRMIKRRKRLENVRGRNSSLICKWTRRDWYRFWLAFIFVLWKWAISCTSDSTVTFSSPEPTVLYCSRPKVLGKLRLQNRIFSRNQSDQTHCHSVYPRSSHLCKTQNYFLRQNCKVSSKNIDIISHASFRIFKCCFSRYSARRIKQILTVNSKSFRHCLGVYGF